MEKKYIIVCGENAGELEEKVNELTHLWYVPHGSIIWIESQGVLVQPMKLNRNK